MKSRRKGPVPSNSLSGGTDREALGAVGEPRRTEDGWPDPADVFAESDQITGLRAGLAELTAEGNPYLVPLPDGCILLPEANFNPFEYGRLYNGMVQAALNPFLDTF